MVDPATQVQDLAGVRALAVLGDSVTTDHISPAGNIAVDSPAGKYLMSLGVKPADFNSYGARRGNHEVMVRGTLANIRLRNQMAPGTEGGWTTHMPDRRENVHLRRVGEVSTRGRAAADHRRQGIWHPDRRAIGPRKGVLLLGVRAVIAESFERIHRSNLVGMGVLPLQFVDGQNRESLGLTGFETYKIEGIREAVESSGKVRAHITAAAEGQAKKFDVKVRIDTPVETEYFRSGGILPHVLRQLSS